jgi:VIT1/CCC1 family predicted Fe2+/Mn2+ transporter
MRSRIRAGRKHHEQHRTSRIGWLRAAVLGADDGIVSTGSLIIGVASAHATPRNILIAGIAGLVAGSMSMAAGEYVSVHSQADTEKAELSREAEELATDPVSERQELSAIYVTRGVEPALAREVAEQLMAHDALGAHARDELGISKITMAQPIQAALASAGSFAAGALLPLAAVALAPSGILVKAVFGVSLLCLAFLGALAAWVGGAHVWTGAARITFWGALAMAVTAGVGSLFGTVVQ